MRAFLSRSLSDYGMLVVLILLCAFYSWRTVQDQHPKGADAARAVARALERQLPDGARVAIVTGGTTEDAAYAAALARELEEAGLHVAASAQGSPAEARAALEAALADGPLAAVAATEVTARWPLLQSLRRQHAGLAAMETFSPQPYRWPTFLNTANLINIANQIVVIAILAIGMTLVIITGGIDLSVGSLVAFSSVVATLLIREAAGAEQAGAAGMLLCCLAAIALCGVFGLASGTLVTLFRIPPFIVTLGMMLVASGCAYLLAQGQSIYQVPGSFTWLGRGTAFNLLPNAVLLMAVLYAVTHIVMTRMTFGRYVYAVGGNQEAARLSGVPVGIILLLVYFASGLFAGLGGVITASQLRSGSPNYGLMYELYVIAAVVVGGTSLSGGEGRILGTLIGAFIIAVIQNGMNLTGVESYTQKVVLGLVILLAVLLDMLKKNSVLPTLLKRLRRRPAS